MSQIAKQTTEKNQIIRWTKEEVDTFVTFLKAQKYSNIQQACELYAVSQYNIHNRTSDAISFKYYSTVRKHYEIFFMANSQGGVRNTKIVPRDTAPDYQPIEVIMKQLLDLDKEKRDKILAFFK